MARLKFLLIGLFVMAMSSERSFVSTAPTATSSEEALKGSPEVVPETLDANVRELESLKQTIGKTLEMMKTQSSIYTNLNGNIESHQETNSQVKENGKLQADITERIGKDQPSANAPASGSRRIHADIPERSIRKSSVQRLLPDIRPQPQREEQQPKRSSGRSQDETNDDDDNALPGAFATEKFGNSQYTPLDMAEYIFWTGDEKGVTLAIEELLQAGLMTREEAILFLQEIKYNLDYLQKHYSAQLRLNGGSGSGGGVVGDRAKINNENEILAEDLLKYKETLDEINELQQLVRPTLSNNFDLTQLRYQPVKRIQHAKLIDTEQPNRVSSIEADQDYDELMDRLRTADFLYTEYSLEEIIYQLAKVMFTQGLTRGSSQAQQALQKFTSFLETEAEQGHISKALEKKVLDVLIASLTDTLSEHPEIQTIRAYALDENRRNALRQIVQMIPQDKRPRVDIQLDGESRKPFMGMTKYKTIN